MTTTVIFVLGIFTFVSWSCIALAVIVYSVARLAKRTVKRRANLPKAQVRR